MSTKKLNEALAILDSCLEHPNAPPDDRATCRAAIAELEAIERAAQDITAFAAVEHATSDKDEQRMVDAAERLLERIAKESTHD